MRTAIQSVTTRLRMVILGLAIPLLVSACSHREDAAPPPPPKPDTHVIDSAGDITTAQGLLTSLGYDAGPADGVIGPRTIAAIRAFQKDRHIEENGALTQSLLDRLKSARAKRPEGALPRYEAGTVFIYSDGASEAVGDVADRGIRPSGAGGAKDKQPNFLILAAPGERSDAPADFLQPLRPGSKGEYHLFDAEGARKEIATVTCAVGHPRRRAVMAGTFAAIDVSCTKSTGKMPPVTHEWAYAPALRAILRETARRGDTYLAARELVAIRPATGAWPAAARSGFDWAIVNALRDADKHEGPVDWASTGVDERFSIHVDPARMEPPRRLPDAGSAKLCLRYRLTRTDAAGEGQTYPALACRSDDGEWWIPARPRIALESPPKGL